MDSLFEEFPAVSKKEWLEKVKKDLKGQSLDELNWQFTDHFALSPFTHADDFSDFPPPLWNRQKDNQWEIGVKIPPVDYEVGNQVALQSLTQGANALCFVLNEIPTQKELANLLKDIQLEWISVHFELNTRSWRRITTTVADFITKNGFSAHKVNGSFCFQNLTSLQPEEINGWQQLSQRLPCFHFHTINARPLYQGKNHTVQELYDTIGQVHRLLANLTDAGIAPAVTAQRLQFSLTIGDSFLLNIAKIRVLKILWQHIAEAWNITHSTIPPVEVHLTATTQTDNPNTNKIKATAQAMSAIIGGVQRLYIHPSDEFKDGVGSDFARRIALNIQHLIQMESYMNRVIDPAAGSYYIENLTNTLAERVWESLKG